MKKNLMFAAITALCTLSLSSCGDKEATASTEAAAPAKPADHIACAKALIASMEKITSILGTVTDKASADAAAPRLAPALAEMKEVTSIMEKLGEPTGESKTALDAMEAEGRSKTDDMMGKLMPILISEYYGSEALRTVFEENK